MPTPGAGTPETLAVGAKGKWFDCRPYAGNDIPIIITVAGGGVGRLEASMDPVMDPTGALKTGILAIEDYTVDSGRVLIAPLPNFLRIRNVGGAGTVTYAFGEAESSSAVQVSPQSTETTRTGAFGN